MNKYDNQYSLGDVLQQIVDRFHLRSRMNSENVKNYWSEIAGKVVAKYTKTVELRDNLLYIEVTEPALKNELLYMQEDIIASVNKYLKSEVVEKIIIR
ncbi:MAG: DUF721 domain-containing protein [Bacteroidales bacterium]|jgi:predicted nucleic acid-binding Zn ribbon protein|nr:DUF721 domain-containing protein [Bacteroidales bacterium]